MLSAEMLSKKIRMRRKGLKEEGVENMIDTAPLPQMNPQDIWNLEKQAQMEETIPGADEIEAGPMSPVMEEEDPENSQDIAVLKKHMARIGKILNKLSVG